MAISNEVKSPQIFSLWVVHSDNIFIVKGKKTHSSLVGGMKCLNEGLKNISVGTTDYTGGADVIPNVRLSAMKPEAHKSLVCG